MQMVQWLHNKSRRIPDTIGIIVQIIISEDIRDVSGFTGQTLSLVLYRYK